MSETQYCIVLFKGTSQAMQAEKACRKANIDVRLLPVPRQFSSDCGVCMRFFIQDKPRVAEELNEKKVEYSKIVEID